MVKLLTSIFRARQATEPHKPASRVEAHTVNYMLTEFRRNIVPQTCALLFLQGVIRRKKADPESFPLQMWDMERMYEGIHQFLEFLAVIAENEIWKDMLTEWEMAVELVTLIRELDEAIPKECPETIASKAGKPKGRAVAVERPYDNVGPEGVAPLDQSAYMDDEGLACDFEWRDLKKLAVLVLSSIAYKNKTVQDQAREAGGVEAVLGCCSIDDYNPYIREHAIMCLRFLLEGNAANQQIVRELEAQQVVPNEVLDQHGYETHMEDGHIELRRKAPAEAPSAPSGAGSGMGSIVSNVAEAASASFRGAAGGSSPLSSAPSSTTATPARAKGKQPVGSSAAFAGSGPYGLTVPTPCSGGDVDAEEWGRSADSIERLFQQVRRDLPIRAPGAPSATATEPGDSKSKDAARQASAAGKPEEDASADVTGSEKSADEGAAEGAAKGSKAKTKRTKRGKGKKR